MHLFGDIYPPCRVSGEIENYVCRAHCADGDGAMPPTHYRPLGGSKIPWGIFNARLPPFQELYR